MSSGRDCRQSRSALHDSIPQRVATRATDVHLGFKGLFMTRTSLTHPLIIAELPVGTEGGAIGVTFAPGKYQPLAMTGAWSRDLDQDLEAIERWGAKHLISLLEPWEFAELRIEGLAATAEVRGIRWHGLPITDGAAPDHRFLQKWPALSPILLRDLQLGMKIIVHCKGGLGRAGTVAAMLLLESGTVQSSRDAISMVRRVRPGAIETVEQESFLEGWCTRLGRAH